MNSKYPLGNVSQRGTAADPRAGLHMPGGRDHEAEMNKIFEDGAAFQIQSRSEVLRAAGPEDSFSFHANNSGSDGHQLDKLPPRPQSTKADVKDSHRARDAGTSSQGSAARAEVGANPQTASQFIRTINTRGYLRDSFYNLEGSRIDGSERRAEEVSTSEKRGGEPVAQDMVTAPVTTKNELGIDLALEAWSGASEDGEFVQTIRRVQTMNKEQLELTQQQLETLLRETLLGQSQKWISNSRTMVTSNTQSLADGLEQFDQKNKDLAKQRTEKKERLEKEKDRLGEELKSLEKQQQHLIELKKPLEVQLESQKKLEKERRRQRSQERRYFESQRRAAAASKGQRGFKDPLSIGVPNPNGQTMPEGQVSPDHAIQNSLSEPAGVVKQLQGMRETQLSQNSMITVKNQDISLKRPVFDMRNEVDDSRYFRDDEGNTSPEDSSVLPDRADSLAQTKAHNLSQVDLKSKSARSRTSPDPGVPAIGAASHSQYVDRRIREGSLQTPAISNLQRNPERANFATFNQDQEDAEVGHAHAMAPDWSTSAGLPGSASEMGTGRQQLLHIQEQLGHLEDSGLGPRHSHQSQSIAHAASNFGNMGLLGLQHKKEGTLLVHPRFSERRLLDEAGTELSDVQEADLYQQPYDSEVGHDQSEDGHGPNDDDEENVDLEEADELNSDKGSAPMRVANQSLESSYLRDANRQQDGQGPHDQQKQPMDVNTGKFNELMNQIIGEFAENDAEGNDPEIQIDGSELLTQTPNREHSKGRNSQNPSSLAQSAKLLPPNLSSLSQQYMSNADRASQYPGTNLTLSATDPITEAVNYLKKETQLPTAQADADGANPGSVLSLPHPSKSVLEHRLNQIHLDFVYVSAKIADTKKALGHVEDHITELEEALQVLQDQNEHLQTFKNMSEQQKASFWKGLDELDEFLMKNVSDTMKANHVNITKVEASMQQLNSVDQMLKLKSTSWEEEIRNLQDKCQQRQFQVDHLKREMAELMLEQTDPGKNATTNRSLIEKQHQQKQEAAQRNFQTLLQNETFQSLGILQRQISKLYNKLLEYNNKRHQAIQDKQLRLNAGDGPSHFEERNNVLLQDDVDIMAFSQTGSKATQKINWNALKSARFDLPELDFIEVLPNSVAGGSMNVTQENFNLTRQNMKRKTIQIDQAAQILSDICNENRRLSEVIETVSAMSLRNYFELSRTLRSELSQEEHDEIARGERQKEMKKTIAKKIQDSIQELRTIQMRGQSQIRGDYYADGLDSQKGSELEERSNITGAASNVSNYYQSEHVPFSFKYIHRFNEMINEARGMFVVDLSALQHEMATSRKLLIQVHRSAESQKKENQMLVSAHAQVSSKLTSLQETYEELNKKKEKTALQLSKLEGENQSYLLQIEKLELIKNNKDKQILKMMEEIKSYQAQVSKTEQMVFDHQTEIQRKKAQITEYQQTLVGNQEETQEQKDQIEILKKEIKSLKGQAWNKQQEALLRDVGNWMTDCITYNDNFLDNQELINQLQMTIDEPHGSGSWEEEDQSERIIFDVVNIEEVARIVRKINQQSAKFEPTRSRLKQNIYMIRKRINEYRQLAQNMRIDNKRALMNQTKQNSEHEYRSGRSQRADNQLISPSPSKIARQMEADKSRSRQRPAKSSLNRIINHPQSLDEQLDLDVLSTFERPYPARTAEYEDHDQVHYADDELRLRLDVCQEEKYELQRKLKQQNMKVQKLDEFRMKFESINEIFKQLRSRFSILIDKLKNLHEQHPDTALAEEISKVLRKMSNLPPIQQLNISYLPGQDSSWNRKSGYQGGKFKSQMEAGLDNTSQLGGGGTNRGTTKSNRLKSQHTYSPTKSPYHGEGNNFLIASDSDGQRMENEHGLKDGSQQQRKAKMVPNNKTQQNISKHLADSSRSNELSQHHQIFEDRQDAPAGRRDAQKESNDGKPKRGGGNGNLKVVGSEYQSLIEDGVWTERADKNMTEGSGEKLLRHLDRLEAAKEAITGDNRSADYAAARHWSFGADAEQQIALALQIQKDAVKRTAQGTQTEACSTREASCQTEEEFVGEAAQRLSAEAVAPDDLSMFIQNQNELILSLKNLDKASNSGLEVNHYNSLANPAIPSRERTIVLSQTELVEGTVGDERAGDHVVGSSNFQSQGDVRGASLSTTPAEDRELLHVPQRSSFNSGTAQQETESHIHEGGEQRQGSLAVPSRSSKLIPSPASDLRRDSQKPQQSVNGAHYDEDDEEENYPTLNQHPQHDGSDSLINAVEISLPERDRSRASIQILDQALPHPRLEAHQDPASDAHEGHQGHRTPEHELRQADALLDADQRMQHYENKFEEIQREMNAIEQRKNSSTVVVDAQRLKQELAMTHTEYSDQTYDDDVQWAPSTSRQDLPRVGEWSKQQDMLIIEESRDQEQIERELLGPGRHGSRGSAHQQASGGEDYRERPEDQYDFSEKASAQTPQRHGDSTGSGNLPEDREHFFQIDENEEAAQGGDDFQLDESDSVEPYGNNPDEHLDNQQMLQNQNNRFGMGQGMLYQQPMPETIQEELEGEGESNFGSRDFQNMNISKVSRISRASHAPSQNVTANHSHTPSSGAGQGHEGTRAAAADASKSSLGSSATDGKATKRSRRAKYSNNSKYLSRNARSKNHEGSQKSENDVEIMSSAVISQNQDGLHEGMSGRHSQTDSMSHPAEPRGQPLSSRSSQREAPAMIMVQQAIRQEGLHRADGSHGSQLGSSNVHNVSPHSLSLESGHLNHSEQLPDSQLQDNTRVAGLGPGRKSPAVQSNARPPAKLAKFLAPSSPRQLEQEHHALTNQNSVERLEGDDDLTSSEPVIVSVTSTRLSFQRKRDAQANQR